MIQRQKILVVDDNQISLNVSVLLLKGIEAEFVTATSGEEAIKKTIAEDFDLILMDVMMEGIDGFEAVKIIRNDERNKAIPVIFITALPGDERRIIKGLSLGAIDFLIKPVSKEILCLKAANLLELQRTKRELELTKRRLDQKISEVEAMSMESQLIAKTELETILRTCMDGFILSDINGKILEVNNAYRAIIGYTREELCSMFIHNIEAVNDEETTKKHIEEVINSGSDKFESVHRSKDGNLIPVEVGVKYSSENNRIYAFIKDITVQKQTEKIKLELEKILSEKESLITELNKSFARIKTLDSILPICSCCRKIRDDKGYWEQVDIYIRDHTDTQFSHSICPDCAKKLYPDLHL